MHTNLKILYKNNIYTHTPTHTLNKTKTYIYTVVCMSNRNHDHFPIPWTIYRQMFLGPKELLHDLRCHFLMDAKMHGINGKGKTNIT